MLLTLEYQNVASECEQRTRVNDCVWMLSCARLFVVMRPGFPRRRIRVDKRHVTPHGETVKHLKMHHFDHFALTFCISHLMTFNDVIRSHNFGGKIISLCALNFNFHVKTLWHVTHKRKIPAKNCWINNLWKILRRCLRHYFAYNYAKWPWKDVIFCTLKGMYPKWVRAFIHFFNICCVSILMSQVSEKNAINIRKKCEIKFRTFIWKSSKLVIFLMWDFR